MIATKFLMNKHPLTQWTIGCIIIGVILNPIGIMLPKFSTEQNLVFKITEVFMMIAFGCMSKIHGKHNEDIPSVGFSILAIAQAIFFSSIAITGFSDYENGIAGIMFYLPAMIMIFYSKLYPFWIRLFGVLGSLPFLFMMYAIFTKTYVQNSVLENTVWSCFQLTTIFWAVYIWKHDGKKKETT